MKKPPSLPQESCGRTWVDGHTGLATAVFVCLFFLSGFPVTATQKPVILGYAPVSADGSNSYKNVDGSWQITLGEDTSLVVFGEHLLLADVVTLTEDEKLCDQSQFRGNFSAESTNTTGFITVNLPTGKGIDTVYFCLDGEHQSNDPETRVLAAPPTEDVLPESVTVVFLVVLFFLSGLFSGLNLGLMTLSPSELKVVVEAGDPDEVRYAKAILPLRKRGNLLLCTVLLGNVLVNSTLTILLESLAGGLAAVLGSTAGIVVFGEIVPQSVCSRHALWVGAKTIWLTKFFMLVTLPMSYPISVVLDKVLGEEVGAVYQRKQLLHLVRIQDAYNDLARDEFDIITGALTFKEKTAKMVMTPIDDVFMLDIDSILDFKTVTKIMDSGHSRIPTYRGSRENIVGLLYVKDLAFIDPDDKTPLESVIKFYNHRLEEVYDNTRLDVLLDMFKRGRTHMVLVMSIKQQTDKDPVREVVGIATLEDVIEEIIQTEIIDETDRIVDNVSKRLVKRDDRALPASILKPTAEDSKLSEQMGLAVFTHLSTVVEAFSTEHLLPSVLRRLIHLPRHQVEIVRSEVSEDQLQIYHAGQRTNIFTMIIEGRVKVDVGQEHFKFTAGPFECLGVSALTQSEFVPDFSAFVDSDRVLLLQISQKHYVEAKDLSRRAAIQGFASPAVMRAAESDARQAHETLDVSDDTSAADSSKKSTTLTISMNPLAGSHVTSSSAPASEGESEAKGKASAQPAVQEGDDSGDSSRSAASSETTHQTQDEDDGGNGRETRDSVV